MLQTVWNELDYCVDICRILRCHNFIQYESYNIMTFGHIMQNLLHDTQ